MADAAFALASHYGWPWAGLAAMTILAAGAAWQWTKLHRRNSRLLTAHDNMPQGLCMWSPTGRLILCNERYIQMYRLSSELTTPGVSLRDLIDHRIKIGNFT